MENSVSNTIKLNKNQFKFQTNEQEDDIYCSSKQRTGEPENVNELYKMNIHLRSLGERILYVLCSAITRKCAFKIALFILKMARQIFTVGKVAVSG